MSYTNTAHELIVALADKDIKVTLSLEMIPVNDTINFGIELTDIQRESLIDSIVKHGDPDAKTCIDIELEQCGYCIECRKNKGGCDNFELDLYIDSNFIVDFNKEHR
jgi:hypothetical protein